MKILKLKIKGMTCENCARTIEKIFNDTPGIEKKQVSYRYKTGEFQIDENEIAPDDIVEKINQTHYKVEQVLAIDEVSPEDTSFDLIIIGGGSAAFSAALTAEAEGASVAIFNAGLPTGGTCVNVGCVPSKNLIRKAEAVHKIRKPAFEAIKSAEPVVDFKAIIEDKKHLVEDLRNAKYINVIKDKEKITLISGFAKFKSTNTVIAGAKEYSAKRILIVTGSRTKIPQIKGIEQSGYLTHKTLFELDTLPESITVLGAGYIGLEIAQTFSRFGAKVRIIEFTDRPLRTQSEDISEEIRKFLEHEGIEFFPNYRVDSFENKNGVVLIDGKNVKTGEVFSFTEKGKILVATGTIGNTDNLGLENIGLSVDANQKIIVNEKQETGIENIYAAGDCTNTPAFVYTAAVEGKTAVLNALDIADAKTDYTALPWVVFTDPQIAGAGMDEKQAEEAGINVDTSKVYLTDVPKAIAANDMRGFVKLIRNADTDEVIGIRTVAPEGSEIVMQVAIAIKTKMKVTELANMLFPYLTLSEAIKLAAITFTKDIKELSCCAV